MKNKLTKIIITFAILLTILIPNYSYKDITNTQVQQTESNEQAPKKTEYDTIAITFIILQGVLIGGGIAIYFIISKKKEKQKQEEEQKKQSSTMVFYSSYDENKPAETTEAPKTFTSSSTFSTSNIVNTPNTTNQNTQN